MIVSVIPARGGSKRIPKKNLKLLKGKPLIAYTIEESLKSNVKKTFVSTDNEEISQVSLSLGAHIISRPSEISTDSSTLEATIKHAILFFETNKIDAETIVVLQPTSPLRKSAIINKAIEILLDSDCDSVVGVTKDIKYYFSGNIGVNNSFIPEYDLKNRAMTQDIEPKYYDNGSIYVIKTKTFLKENYRLCGYSKAIIMDEPESIDIDNEFDFSLCNFLLGDI